MRFGVPDRHQFHSGVAAKAGGCHALACVCGTQRLAEPEGRNRTGHVPRIWLRDRRGRRRPVGEYSRRYRQDQPATGLPFMDPFIGPALPARWPQPSGWKFRMPAPSIHPTQNLLWLNWAWRPRPRGPRGPQTCHLIFRIPGSIRVGLRPAAARSPAPTAARWWRGACSIWSTSPRSRPRSRW